MAALVLDTTFTHLYEIPQTFPTGKNMFKSQKQVVSRSKKHFKFQMSFVGTFFSTESPFWLGPWWLNRIVSKRGVSKIWSPPSKIDDSFFGEEYGRFVRPVRPMAPPPFTQDAYVSTLARKFVCKQFDVTCKLCEHSRWPQCLPLFAYAYCAVLCVLCELGPYLSGSL